MNVIFEYNKEKDIWCLLNKGKGSNNSQSATKVYQQLIKEQGENPTSDVADVFIAKYALDNSIVFSEYVGTYQKDWDIVAGEYHAKAQAIFGVSLPQNIVSYLTINNRCPYSIKDNYFFVSVPKRSARETTMHELWHFYTWYGLGVGEEQRIGKQKYNDLKEALTVLLNVEYKDLLDGAVDSGYPQHGEIREKILECWAKDRNMARLWKFLTE